MTAAAEKLQKEGITPFATGYYEGWKLGDHLMNVLSSALLVKKLLQNGIWHTFFLSSGEEVVPKRDLAHFLPLFR